MPFLESVSLKKGKKKAMTGIKVKLMCTFLLFKNLYEIRNYSTLVKCYFQNKININILT